MVVDNILVPQKTLQIKGRCRSLFMVLQPANLATEFGELPSSIWWGSHARWFKEVVQQPQRGLVVIHLLGLGPVVYHHYSRPHFACCMTYIYQYIICIHRVTTTQVITSWQSTLKIEKCLLWDPDLCSLSPSRTYMLYHCCHWYATYDNGVRWCTQFGIPERAFFYL